MDKSYSENHSADSCKHYHKVCASVVTHSAADAAILTVYRSVDSVIVRECLWLDCHCTRRATGVHDVRANARSDAVSAESV